MIKYLFNKTSTTIYKITKQIEVDKNMQNIQYIFSLSMKLKHYLFFYIGGEITNKLISNLWTMKS